VDQQMGLNTTLTKKYVKEHLEIGKEFDNRFGTEITTEQAIKKHDQLIKNQKKLKKMSEIE